MSKQKQTVAEFIANGKSSGPVGESINFSGFYSANDGGDGTWVKTATTGVPSQTPSQLGNAILNDSTGAQWSLSDSDTHNHRCFGTTDDGTTDNKNAFRAWLLSNKKRGVRVPAVSGTYLLSDTIYGDGSQHVIIENNDNFPSYGFYSVAKVTKLNGLLEATQPAGGSYSVSTNETAMTYRRSLVNSGTVGGYGHRFDSSFSNEQLTGFTLGAGFIGNTNALANGAQSGGVWVVANSPLTSSTSTFGSFGMEVNLTNRFGDSGFSDSRGALSNWTSILQVVPESNDLAGSTGSGSYNVTCGLMLSHSGGLKSADSDHAKMYNAILIEKESTVPSTGVGVNINGGETAPKAPASPLKISGMWEGGFDILNMNILSGHTFNSSVTINGSVGTEIGVIVGGKQVVSERGAAISDATDTASAITQLNAALAMLRSHGLIEP